MPHRHEYPRVLSLAVAMLVLLLLRLDILPPVFGVALPLLLPFTVAVGLCEGPFVAAGLGVAAGLVLDCGTTSAYGFSALLLLAVGVFAGVAAPYFTRRTTAALLVTLVCALVCFPLRWFFLCFLWYGTARVFSIVPLQVLYAVLLSIPVYFPVQALSRRFGSLRRAD